MNPTALLQKVQNTPDQIDFSEVMACIDNTYHYTPCSFTCGDVTSEAGTNEGSCKILAFAKIHKLDAAATLALFGEYYRTDVLGNPGGKDHANIRNFMVHEWAGVSFEQEPLSPI